MTVLQLDSGARVRLRPLLAADAGALVQAASDGALWELPFTVVPSADTVGDYIGAALDGQAAGSVMPFATELVATGQVIGSTRFWKIDRKHRKLEIGGTWLARSWQRSFVNTEAKFLMLRFAFETLGCVRVQFTTDETNAKSRAAILRLGARQEGVVRNERLMPDGRKRNSVRFSIIDDEWPGVKRELERRMASDEPTADDSPAPPGLRIRTGAHEQDVSLIHRFLSEESAWARGIPFEVVRRSVQNSLNFGGFLGAEQVAYARVVTDRATFAYLVDVFVLEAHRGKGYSTRLMEAVDAHPGLQGLRRFMLATSTAHGLYARFGFTPPARPHTLMERFVADAYSTKH